MEKSEDTNAGRMTTAGRVRWIVVAGGVGVLMTIAGTAWAVFGSLKDTIDNAAKIPPMQHEISANKGCLERLEPKVTEVEKTNAKLSEILTNQNKQIDTCMRIAERATTDIIRIDSQGSLALRTVKENQIAIQEQLKNFHEDLKQNNTMLRELLRRNNP